MNLWGRFFGCAAGCEAWLLRAIHITSALLDYALCVAPETSPNPASPDNNLAAVGRAKPQPHIRRSNQLFSVSLCRFFLERLAQTFLSAIMRIKNVGARKDLAIVHQRVVTFTSDIESSRRKQVRHRY